MKNSFWLCFPFLGALTLFAANPVLNPGFEVGTGKDGAANWSAPSSTFSYVHGEGRNGTHALRFDVKEGSGHAFPSQTVKLEPGKSYVAHAWVRTENLKSVMGSGAMIAAEWRRADGSWYGGRYSAAVIGTVGEFTKVTLPFTYPADAGRFTISAYVAKGCTGKAWFDDISIVPAIRPLTGPMLVSDVYRNTAASGKMKLSIDVFMPEKDHKAKGVKCLFELPLATGVKTVEVPVTDGFAQTTVDVTDLNPGKTKFSFRLKDGENIVLTEKSLEFTRLKGKMPPWPVRIERNRTLVNGRPFFPLGIFVSRLNDATIADLKKGAFNCAMAYGSPTEKEMDAAHRAGLKVIYSVKDAFFGTRACVGEIKDREGEIEWVKDRVRRFKNHPALLAWYINDELGIELRDRLAARRDLLEELDPGHPTWVALYQVEDLPLYLGTFDVIGTDPYPICQSGNPPISQVAEHTRMTRRSIFGGMAMWQIPQVFDWGGYRKTDVEKTRAPTFDEMRNMQWQFIAEGAMGLVPYAYHSIKKMDWRDKFDVQWKKVCDISREMESHIPMFLSEEPAVKVRGAPTEMAVRTWRWKGKDWILCVNTTRERLTAELDVDLHGKVKVDLPPIGVELKSLTPPSFIKAGCGSRNGAAPQ